MDHEWLREAEDMSGDLVAWRRALHQMPELGLELPQTVAFIKEQLAHMGISCETIVDGSCVVATLGQGDQCMMLRADMDALPVVEETGLDFAAKNGCMHACGHDMHAAMLLGAARLLKAHEKELKGVVKLLFQAGEETFGGADGAVRDGVLENPEVNAAFAMHVASVVPFGVIAYGTNPMSSVYGFKITLTGKGGHGSQPETCIDPINAGVQVYLALQSLIARECPSADEAVLTIGQFEAGNAANIIPERAVLQGTLRTFKRETTEQLIRRIGEIVPAVAAAYRTQAELEVLYQVPSVQCDPALNEAFVQSISSLDKTLHLMPGFHVMGSEDFAFISEKVPSGYFAIGAAVPDQSQQFGQHNPKVQFNEDCLPVGAASYAKVAVDWLAKNKN